MNLICLTLKITRYFVFFLLCLKKREQLVVFSYLLVWVFVYLCISRLYIYLKLSKFPWSWFLLSIFLKYNIKSSFPFRCYTGCPVLYKLHTLYMIIIFMYKVCNIQNTEYLDVTFRPRSESPFDYTIYGIITG